MGTLVSPDGDSSVEGMDSLLFFDPGLAKTDAVVFSRGGASVEGTDTPLLFPGPELEEARTGDSELTVASETARDEVGIVAKNKQKLV